MTGQFLDHLQGVLAQIDADGLRKHERLIGSPQDRSIEIVSGGAARRSLSLCSNNYLGLANHPEVLSSATEALTRYGFGMASVRFICGTQTLHRELEQRIARYLGKDDAILFAACFDANGAVFEPLLEAEDAIVSDALNHASIIDGIRLCRARRYRFANGDMDQLEDSLRQARKDGARFILIATDGVFSMDGYVANLSAICELAERYEAQVMVDDCHATGHLGEGGRGTPALTGAGQRVDIVTGTLGKTLGGAMGGFIAAHQTIIDVLRQRARPYLFSNSLPPPVAAGSLTAIDIAERADERRAQLYSNARRFRQGLSDLGFALLPGETPIIPVMLHDARLSQQMAHALADRGITVTGFFFPVVPKGQARIRVQMSAALNDDDIDFAIDAFADAGRALSLI